MINRAVRAFSYLFKHRYTNYSTVTLFTRIAASITAPSTSLRRWLHVSRDQSKHTTVPIQNNTIILRATKILRLQNM